MRYKYKLFPRSTLHPTFASEASVWMPMLPIQLSVGHGAKTGRIEALIDSGSDDCLFSADIGITLGLDIEKGVPNLVGGIVPGVQVELFYHPVNLWVGRGVLRIIAGFGHKLGAGAILGRRGFFENHIVTFDPSATPPGFEITRLGRA